MKLNLLGAATALILGSAGALAAPSSASFQITSFSQVVSGGTLTWLGGGYQDLFGKLTDLGARIERVTAGSARPTTERSYE